MSRPILITCIIMACFELGYADDDGVATNDPEQVESSLIFDVNKISFTLRDFYEQFDRMKNLKEVTENQKKSKQVGSARKRVYHVRSQPSSKHYVRQIRLDCTSTMPFCPGWRYTISCEVWVPADAAKSHACAIIGESVGESHDGGEHRKIGVAEQKDKRLKSHPDWKCYMVTIVFSRYYTG